MRTLHLNFFTSLLFLTLGLGSLKAQGVKCYTNQFNLKINTSQTNIDTCDKQLTLKVTYTGNPVYLYWNDGYVGGSRTIESSGSYQVYAFDSSWCADTSKTIHIALNDNYLSVSAFPEADEIKLCKGQQTYLYCYSYGPFKWNTKDTTNSIIVDKTGNYFATAISKNGCKDTSNVIKVTFVEFADVKIKSLTDTIVCEGDSVSLELTTNLAGSKYYWSPYYQNNVKKITAKYSGTYFVYVYDSISNCAGYSNKINVTVKTAPIQNLCMVSVDSVTGRNKLTWKKNSGAGIVSYNFYRESNFAGEFDLIGSQAYSDPNFFIDSFSNPKQRPFTYYIAAVDSCGGESQNSKYYAHTTLHLTASLGVSGENNLNWSDYIGIYPLNTYIIYRSNKGSSFQPIASVAASVKSYSDLNPPSGSNRYFIGIKANTDCVDSSQVIYSNMVAFGMLNTENLTNEISVFPNPTNSNIQILNAPTNATLRISNLQGQLVQTQTFNTSNPVINIETLPNGIYLITINNLKPIKIVKSN